MNFRNQKVDNFINWYEKSFLDNDNYYESVKQEIIVSLRNFIEKMAVWYELRYTDAEVMSLEGYEKYLDDVRKNNIVIFRDNSYLLNVTSKYDRLYDRAIGTFLDELKWSKFYNFKTFYSSLSDMEKRYFEKAGYPRSITIDINDKYITLDVNSDGEVYSRESKNCDMFYLNDKFYQQHEFNKMHLKDFISFLEGNTDFEISYYGMCILNSIIDNFEKKSYFKEELLNCVMARIMERGRENIGLFRAKLFAEEFDRDINAVLLDVDKDNCKTKGRKK